MNDLDKELKQNKDEKQNKDDIRHLIFLILRKTVRKAMLFLIPMAMFSGMGALMYLSLPVEDVTSKELALRFFHFTIFIGFIGGMATSYLGD
nr:hypothetical protein [uncultured Butyrivibrio sp.]